jgi:hypothetical protein
VQGSAGEAGCVMGVGGVALLCCSTAAPSLLSCLMCNNSRSAPGFSCCCACWLVCPMFCGVLEQLLMVVLDPGVRRHEAAAVVAAAPVTLQKMLKRSVRGWCGQL